MLDLLRFFSFLFKDEPVPAVLLLAFRFVVKKFLDFPFFLYFFFFRRCCSRRRKILNLFSCFLSLYFTRIFYRLSFSLHFFLSLSKNFQIFSLHRTFLSSSSISSSSKRILVLVTINYWKIFSFFFFFHNNETLNRFMTNSTISLEFIIRRFASIVSFDLIFQNVAQRKFGNPVSGVPLYTPSPRTIFLPF